MSDLGDRILGWLAGDGGDSTKDKDYHAASHRWGLPGHSNDNKGRDAGSSSTGQTWSELDPDGNGEAKQSWFWMVSRDLLA